MLEIKSISKTYRTGSLVQKALDNVSLNLRDNEFVAILGPSGSGKTTLLNIIGGLDRYDSGDLIINHVSTVKYKDRDWDAYRNHTIGFVFQSYNLIPHQTVLANVEMALTISGISGKERTTKALEALDKVGLKEQAHKKPNQMSGGQMQRVAIARALVNDPDILLADEPTGALDSKTSYQVMDLLKEVAKDRLVVMVSHNPELAEEYATRIVRIKDGKITADSDPYEVTEEVAAQHRKLGKAHMGILTALSLSFNNLISKKSRTLLTAFAGSIGIIGIALILALSSGFQNYIDTIQEETMSSYPLSINADTANIFSAIMAHDLNNEGEEIAEGFVKEVPVIANAVNSLDSNDLKSFKKWLENNSASYQDDINHIEYSYSVDPLIYGIDATGAIVQLNPSTILSAFYSDSTLSMMSSMGGNNAMMGAFYEKDFADMSEYELLAGRLPTRDDEVLAVLSNEEMMPDLIVYSLGLKDTSELKTLVQQVLNGEESTVKSEPITFSYDDLMKLDLRLIEAHQLYRYNVQYNSYEDMRNDEDFVKSVYEQSLKLKVTGVAKTSGQAGILYSKNLSEKVRADAAKSTIVQKQLANKDIDVFSGKAFADNEDKAGLNFNDLVTIDESLLKEAFKVNLSAADFNFGSAQQLQESIMADARTTAETITSGPNVTQLTEVFAAIDLMMTKQYVDLYESNHLQVVSTSEKYLLFDDTDLGAVAQTINAENYQNGLDSALTIMGATAQQKAMLQMLQREDYEHLAAAVRRMFELYFQTIRADDDYDAINQKIAYAKTTLTIDGRTSEVTVYGSYDPLNAANNLLSYQLLLEVATDSVAVSHSTAAINNIMNNYTTYVVAAGIGTSVARVTEPLGKLSEKLAGDLISFDTNKFAQAFNFEMDEAELQRLMSSLVKSQSASYKNNLLSLGYQAEDEPTAISFYFKDFKAKEHFLGLLDDYNEQVNEEQKLSYTDLTGLIMSSVSTIINSVTYVLITFVSISLIVSSIMIAVITLISVMERTKEIGILRAMGASKSNVSSIFTAETFIIGFLSGTLGILVSYALLIPINMVIHDFNQDISAVLDIRYALVLIGISVLLTLVSGLIPSRKAAKQDPVIALRSE